MDEWEFFDRDSLGRLLRRFDLDLLHLTKLPNQGRKYNQIFIVHTVQKKDLVLKVIPDKSTLIGEETIADMIYDCQVNELVSKLTGTQKSRLVLANSKDGDSFIKQPYILLSAIQGDKLNPKHKGKLSEFISEALCLISEVSSKTIEAKMFLQIPKDIFEKYHCVSFPDSPNGKPVVGFSDLAAFPAVKYYRADVTRESPELYKEEFLRYIDTYIEINGRDSSYCLIHADLKPSNVIVDSSGTLSFIDWSRSLIGDVALDLADLLVCALVYKQDDDHFFEDFTKILASGNSISERLIGPNLTDRLKFYASFKLFSIARVFAPHLLSEAGEKIIKNIELPLNQFLSKQKWVIGQDF